MKASKIARVTVGAMIIIFSIGFIGFHMINQYRLEMTPIEIFIRMIAHGLFGCIPIGLVFLVIFKDTKK